MAEDRPKQIHAHVSPARQGGVREAVAMQDRRLHAMAESIRKKLDPFSRGTDRASRMMGVLEKMENNITQRVDTKGGKPNPRGMTESRQRTLEAIATVMREIMPQYVRERMRGWEENSWTEFSNARHSIWELTRRPGMRATVLDSLLDLNSENGFKAASAIIKKEPPTEENLAELLTRIARERAVHRGFAPHWKPADHIKEYWRLLEEPRSGGSRITTVEQCVKDHVAASDAHLEIGNLTEAAELRHEAAALVRRFFQKDKGGKWMMSERDAVPHYEKAVELYKKAGQSVKGKEVLKELADFGPKVYQFDERLAQIHEELGNLKEAQRLYLKLNKDRHVNRLQKMIDRANAPRVTRKLPPE